LVAIAVGVLVLAAVAGVVVADRAADNERLAARQKRLDDYSDRLKGVIQAVSDTATEMGRAPLAPQDPRVDGLDDESANWTDSLGQAQTQLSKISPVDGTETSQQLVVEALASFMNAAKAYELAPVTPEQSQGDILANASGQRDLGGRLLQTAIAELDAVLADADMEPSGIAPPQPAAPGIPPAAPGAPEAPGGDGGKRQGGKGDG
jgi:hypothetical protein